MDTILIKTGIHRGISEKTDLVNINYQFFYTYQRGFHWKLLGKLIFKELRKIRRIIFNY